jgi:cytochrome b
MRHSESERNTLKPAATTTRQVVVWDLPTRLFHWLAAILVAAAYATWRLNWMDWHVKAGYALLALVLFRIVWGVVGSQTARFAGFVTAPRTALRHLARILRRAPDHQVGHNPAGGWMVLLLLALLLAETLSGIYIDNDVADVGPLTGITPAAIANAITSLHAILWDVLLGAVVVHVAAIAIYAVAKRHNLLLPMISGRKLLPQRVPQPRIVGSVWAAVLFAGCAIAVAAIARYL